MRYNQTFKRLAKFSPYLFLLIVFKIHHLENPNLEL